MLVSLVANMNLTLFVFVCFLLPLDGGHCWAPFGRGCASLLRV